MTAPISVLVVDNDPSFVDFAATMLEREDESLIVDTATDGDEALATLEDADVDCIVSDYEMPGTTGLELLEAVRERDPDLPFILFTGRGSEEIASDAIAAGVTQYLQKRPGGERYALLANQITNAVSQYRTETELREHERRYERTLAALHETTRDLMRAGTKEEIYRSTVDTAGEMLDVPVVAAYAFDPDDGVLTLVASTDGAADRLQDETIERGGGRVWEVFSAGEAEYVADLRTASDREPTPRRGSELTVPLGTHGALVVGAEERDGFDETTTELTHILAANTEAALDRAEREALLREHDRTLTRQNEELTRLNHTNEIVREINRAAAQATTRQEIQAAVCDRLADTDRYRFAWIADADETPPTPTDWAGVDATYVDRIREDGGRAPEISLVRDALDSEEVRVVSNALDDPDWESRRTESLTYGYQTVIAVPLADGERRYGALVVHASQADAVSDDEREVLAELGETIGYAIRSVERTRAMVTDSRLELELESRDSRLLLDRCAAAVDGEVTLEGLIDRDDGSVVLFVSAADPTVDELLDLPDRWASLESISIVSESEDRALFEVTGTATPFVEALREFDAHLSAASANEGTVTYTLSVPQRFDARSLVESVRDDYPDTELVARRETNESRSTNRIDTRLRERLTAKQFEALQAAHYSGFFEWPRESTGEDVAAALDVSPPTYHYHLRAAERKLVELAFDTTSN